MSENLSRKILDHVADKRYRPRTLRELANELGISHDDYESFGEVVTGLLDEGQVVRSSENAITLPPPGPEVVGTFRGHEKGFGFLIPQDNFDHGDLFVPPGQTLDAMTGDIVRAKVKHDAKRGGGAKSPYTAKIVEIIERSDRNYVGTLSKIGKKFIAEMDGKALPDPVVIRDPHAKNAKLGDKVVIELIEYPTRRGDWAEGVIVDVLGEAGEPDVETLGVMRAFGLPDQFPAEVMTDARGAARSFGDGSVPEDREDLTGQFICTIDPPDAKDFDDAIHVLKLDPNQEKDNAAYELGVHIADVAHFVKQGSAIDIEAYERGNSTYLPRRVVPMLPELLSNGVCSLQEGVNRYTKTAFIRYNAKGEVVNQRLARTVIQSRKRMTYLEAQALIDDDIRTARIHTKSEPKYSRELIQMVKLMDELAKVIRKRRLDEGMIVLGLPEVELVFDESGRVIDAVPEDDAFTHTVIEMFMVEANEAAARLFDLLDIPMVRRIHADPDAHSTGDLRNFARVAGFNIPANPSRKQLQTLLDSVRGKPAQQAVHFAVLKTLSKAEYSPALIGHFALASEHYTHFTSPIRRYPDLIVHRGLDAIIQAQAKHKKPKAIAKAAKAIGIPDEGQMIEHGKHCSATERNSQTAERELRHYLVLEFLSNHLGEDFPGTVTGVSSDGVYIQIDKYLADGFVPTRDLPGPNGERWKLNNQTGALVALRSGRTISIGDSFTIRIAKIDLPRRKMELVIIEDGKSSTSKKRRLKQVTSPSKQAGGKGSPRSEPRRKAKSGGRGPKKSASLKGQSKSKKKRGAPQDGSSSKKKRKRR